MNFKKIFTAFVLSVGFILPSFSSAFTDISPDSVLNNATNFLVENGVIEDTKYFYPNISVSRGDYLKWLLGGLSDDVFTNNNVKQYFKLIKNY